MDGVFMRKLAKWIGACLLIGTFVWCGTVIADRHNLSSKLIRLHVVAHSDMAEDQQTKLQVRDAVVTYLGDTMDTGLSAGEAKQWLAEHLPELQAVANEVLRNAGTQDMAAVSLKKEAFPVKQYDTFTLPAGVYESLRITIGQGQGQNWWCVVFPSLCLPATSEGFEATAAGAGFPNSLTGALNRQDGYEIRFFFLDWLGKMENFLFRE